MNEVKAGGREALPEFRQVAARSPASTCRWTVAGMVPRSGWFVEGLRRRTHDRPTAEACPGFILNHAVVPDSGLADLPRQQRGATACSPSPGDPGPLPGRRQHGPGGRFDARVRQRQAACSAVPIAWPPSITGPHPPEARAFTGTLPTRYAAAPPSTWWTAPCG